MADDLKTVDPTIEAPTKAASRSAPEADQGTNKMVNLEETTGSLWAEQQEQYAKILKEQDPTMKAHLAALEVEDARKVGSVLHDAEVKKAKLALVATSEKDLKAETKKAAEMDKKVADLEAAALAAEHEGSVLHDAEAKKKALLMGNPNAVKTAVKASK